ncbi:PL29 family lyase N-terminal domain-containing protein [uncultured Bacteroides sp.]|uniref:PL29 family lyase N-terminal domain-containing protein n=1 Tax=uncultured Bacteroides sp. TaxID=162156 RepID=UPI002596C745|nr:PL29 family lyase N-terminal domain-containing protein [uncultured Bacteroides sp.]
MNKKFLNVILFSALMVGSAGTFVSCKDYDDDINGLQEQIDANKKQIDDILAAINGKKFIESYTPVEGGYLLTFAGGETLTIKNGAQGAQGEKGDQGLQGIQGPKGETGATIVPKFKVDAENYWMISVDEGETYEYVLNDAGQKIKAKGADGTNVDVEEVVGNYVKVDEEGYICIGEYRTSFKYNVNIPSMIYNEKDGTMQVTIDGQSYTLLMEGSAFNGLQTIVYRKQAADDKNDYAVAYQLYYPQNETDTDTLFAAVPAKASFKVYPSKFSKSDAELFFSDTYLTRAAEQPQLNVLDWDFDKEQEGVIWVKMTPVNFKNAQDKYTNGWGSITWFDPTTETEITKWGNVSLNIGETYNSYATSLDVKMYGQYVSASDYFNVKSQYASASTIKNVRVNAEDKIQEYFSQNSQSAYSIGRFDYKATYNLNDSISAALNLNNGVLLADAGIQFEQKFELIDENAEKEMWGEVIKKGIFDAEKVAKEGILAVKEELQPSAIDEYAVVKVTTTVKSQVKDVHDLVIYNYVLVQAVRPEVEQSIETIQLSPLGDATFNLDYKTSNQIVKLDVRAFETAIGGRDILTNYSSNIVWPLYKAVYNESKELVRYEQAFNSIENYPADNAWSVDVRVNPDEAFVWFKKAQGNATDSLFLFIGPKTKVEKNTFYLMWRNVKHNGIYTPYAVENRIDNKFFITTINDLAVTRSFDATVKEEYSAQTIIGKWNAEKTKYTLESNSFSDMYIIKPADAVAKYNLDANKQNAYVKELMNKGQLTFNNNTYTVKFEPSVDVAKVKELKIDIYDTEVHKDNFYRTDTWTVKSPLQDFKNTANLGKHYDPTLAKGTVIKFQELAATAWKNLVLKDYIDQTIVSYKNKQLTEAANAAGLYRTKDTSTGLKFTTNTEGWTINENNELVCNIDPTGTVYTKTVTVTVSYKHDWGTTSFNFTIEVIRDVKP